MEPQLVVNGRTRVLGEVGGHVTLLEWLRADGLTGCKEGCAEGECGACAVLVARPDGPDRSRWVAINACLVPAAAFDQQEVVTAEGLGRPGDLHPVQREMADRGGSQCGYCTPGFICSMAAEYYRPGRAAAGASPDGNGTGPRHYGAGPGANGNAAATGSAPASGAPEARTAAGPRCPGAATTTTPSTGRTGSTCTPCPATCAGAPGTGRSRTRPTRWGSPTPQTPSWAGWPQPAPAPAVTTTSSTQGSFVRPASLAGVLELLAVNPDARLVAGSTDWGVELNIRHSRAALTIGIDRIPELREFAVRADYIDLGAALSLSEIEHRLAGLVPLLDDLFPQFASRLIRNGATLGGNLGTASPIGDSPPVLLALDASLVLASATGEREVLLADYFTGYRQSVRQPGELVKTIRIPRPLAPITAFHKIAKRRFDDISSVAVAYALTLDGGAGGAGRASRTGGVRVASIQIGLGGVAATPLRAVAAEQALTGQLWTQETVAAAADTMAQAGTPMSDHRASDRYRTAMLRNSLLKFYAQHRETQNRETQNPETQHPETENLGGLR